MKTPDWSIYFDEAHGFWIAESDTGVKIFADEKEKLAAWLNER